MQRRIFLRNIGLLSAGLALPGAQVLANEGKEFVSRQLSGKISSNGQGIPDVVVSDGYTVAATDKQGKYKMQTHHDARFVFISLPSGYEIPNEQGIARFYRAIDKSGQAQEVNFELQKMAGSDEQHTFIVWADPQMRNNGYDAEQFHSTSVPDTKAHISSLGNVPVFGIGCGDIAFDHFEVYDDYKKGLQQRVCLSSH
jgi:hypothetical protein